MTVRPFVYRQRTPRDLFLRLLKLAIDADSYESVLNSLGTGIQVAIDRIERTGGADEIADYETEIIESLLGVAYVTCQVQINAVVEAALRIPGHNLTKFGLHELGPRFDKSYSMVEVVCELANYFKHRDEWTRETWTSPERRTIAVIKAAGLSCGSSGNLRTGAGALGNSTYADVARFHELVRSWSEQVHQRVRGEP